MLVDHDTLVVNYEYKDDSFDRPGNTSVAIASMVTAYARLKLLRELEKIESSSPGRVLYFDTDSVIYVDKRSEDWYNPKLGNFLGEMTDEVAKDYGVGAYICEFASGGPKNYAYKVRKADGSESTAIKAKGISINSKAKQTLNFDLVKESAAKYAEGETVETEIEQLQFRSDKMHNVYTTVFPKVYRLVSEKRAITNCHPYYQTVPFGYKDTYL